MLFGYIFIDVFFIYNDLFLIKSKSLFDSVYADDEFG